MTARRATNFSAIPGTRSVALVRSTAVAVRELVTDELLHALSVTARDPATRAKARAAWRARQLDTHAAYVRELEDAGFLLDEHGVTR